MRTISIGRFGRVGGLVACFAWLVCAASLGGCAFGTRNARLVYPPPETTGATAPGPEVGTVSLVVADGREGERMIVGHVRNGLAMKTADIVVTESPVDWVRRALEIELANAGVRVVGGDGGGARLSARIVRIECDAYFTYNGNVDLATELTVAGRPLRSEVFAGEGGAGMNWGSTEDSYSESLAIALQAAARKVAEAVRAALVPASP